MAILKLKNETTNEWEDIVTIKGDKGDKPNHEIAGTKIRFQNPDGTWGDWIELEVLTAEQIPTDDGSNVQKELDLLNNRGYYQIRLSSTFNLTSTGDSDRKPIPFDRIVSDVGEKVTRTGSGNFTFNDSGFVIIDVRLINYTSGSAIKTGLIASTIALNGVTQMGTFFSPPSHNEITNPFQTQSFRWQGKVNKNDVLTILGFGDGVSIINTLMHVYSTLSIEFQKI